MKTGRCISRQPDCRADDKHGLRALVWQFMQELPGGLLFRLPPFDVRMQLTIWRIVNDEQ